MRIWLSLILFLFTGSLSAAYVGNTSAPGVLQTGLFSVHNRLINVTSGYISDIVWDKRIRPSDQPDYVSLDKVDEFEIRSNWGTFSLIFLRRLQIYTYLGVSKEKMDWTNKPDFDETSEVKTRNHFSYCVGGKVILLQFLQTSIGLDVQYFSLPSSNDVVQRIKNLNLPFEMGSQYLKVKEWHVALGIASKIGPLGPYAGAKYMKMRLRVKSDNDFPTLKFCNRNNWGTFVGCSLNLSNNFYVNVEGRFLDEYAFAASATAAF